MPRPEGKRVPVNRLMTKILYEPATAPRAQVGIVEDHEEIIDGLAPQFVWKGYRVTGFAINDWERPTEMQQRALADQIAQSGIDLAVVDGGLGYVNGMDLCRRLKETGIPTMLLTGARRTSENEDAADEFIPKPILPSELVRRVGTRLGMSEPDESE